MTHAGTLVRTAWAAALIAGMALPLAPARARAAVPVHPTISAPPSGRWRDASLDDYRTHLSELTALVEACAKARNPANCDPLLVGPDDRVPLGAGANAERRLVRYGWLRVLLSKAQEPDEPQAKPASGQQNSPAESGAQLVPFTTSQLLQEAQTRLAGDLAQAGALAAAAPAPASAYTQVRGVMKQVLAGAEFRNLQQPTVRDTVMEKLGNWLNSLFESASRLRARAPWVGRVIVWGFILAVCIGLIWGLLQLERRWRVRLVPLNEGPAPGAASARDWQLWLKDARRAAAEGRWREAIHFVYWASISRLESRRLWPADRARTPREYLALVAPEDPRRAGLAQLTGSFERTWYGGRPAGERDYRQAEELAQGADRGRLRNRFRRRCAMNFLSSLDAKDRRLLLWSLGIGVSLAVLIGFLMPSGNGNNNPLPSTYLAGQHGARAAYETLLRSGYPLERWERPLSELAAAAGPDTVVIFAEPFSREAAGHQGRAPDCGARRARALHRLLGRLPPARRSARHAQRVQLCRLRTGTRRPRPAGRLRRRCGWFRKPPGGWAIPPTASSTVAPGSPRWWSTTGARVTWCGGPAPRPWRMARWPARSDLDLLLDSLGPRQGHHFYWDESLHGDVRSNWSYASGPALTLLRIGLPVLGMLIVFSFSRRSGPVRDLPQPARTAPVEFLEALGSLYSNAGAASTAVAVAWERFRRRSLRLCGLRPGPMSAAELAAAIRRRFPTVGASLEADLTACEEASWSETIDPREALKLIQALHAHQEKLAEAARPGHHARQSEDNDSNPQERAS